MLNNVSIDIKYYDVVTTEVLEAIMNSELFIKRGENRIQGKNFSYNYHVGFRTKNEK